MVFVSWLLRVVITRNPANYFKRFCVLGCLFNMPAGCRSSGDGMCSNSSLRGELLIRINGSVNPHRWQLIGFAGMI
jgi:hypothetical protein